MRWLVHHEFGVDHWPCASPGQALPTGAQDGTYDGLSAWNSPHGHLLDCITAQIRPVIYEDLGDPAVWQRVADFVSIPGNGETGLKPSLKTSDEGFDPALLGTARDLYARLRPLKPAFRDVRKRGGPERKPPAPPASFAHHQTGGIKPTTSISAVAVTVRLPEAVPDISDTRRADPWTARVSMWSTVPPFHVIAAPSRL